jgi:membrane protein
MRVRKRALVAKFFADRGTHLAAMIAYFALLSFVPLLLLALALLGLAHQADEGSFFVTELNRILPGASLDNILKAVRSIQDNATAIGIIGGVTLLWTSLSLFSVLESAFNIVYDRPNRSFFHGKLIASVLLIGSLATLFASLVIGSVGVRALDRYAPGFIGNAYVAYAASVLASLLGVFFFLLTVYYVLTNEPLSLRDVLPGAIVAAIALEASFQVLPIYVSISKNVPVLQAIGGPIYLLVWLYVMSNVIVFGAEVNWWFGRRRDTAALREEAVGLA